MISPNPKQNCPHFSRWITPGFLEQMIKSAPTIRKILTNKNLVWCRKGPILGDCRESECASRAPSSPVPVIYSFLCTHGCECRGRFLDLITSFVSFSYPTRPSAGRIIHWCCSCHSARTSGSNWLAGDPVRPRRSFRFWHHIRYNLRTIHSIDLGSEEDAFEALVRCVRLGVYRVWDCEEDCSHGAGEEQAHWSSRSACRDDAPPVAHGCPWRAPPHAYWPRKRGPRSDGLEQRAVQSARAGGRHAVALEPALLGRRHPVALLAVGLRPGPRPAPFAPRTPHHAPLHQQGQGGGSTPPPPQELLPSRTLQVSPLASSSHRNKLVADWASERSSELVDPNS